MTVHVHRYKSPFARLWRLKRWASIPGWAMLRILWYNHIHVYAAMCTVVCMLSIPYTDRLRRRVCAINPVHRPSETSCVCYQFRKQTVWDVVCMLSIPYTDRLRRRVYAIINSVNRPSDTSCVCHQFRTLGSLWLSGSDINKYFLTVPLAGPGLVDFSQQHLHVHSHIRIMCGRSYRSSVPTQWCGYFLKSLFGRMWGMRSPIEVTEGTFLLGLWWEDVTHVARGCWLLSSPAYPASMHPTVPAQAWT